MNFKIRLKDEKEIEKAYKNGLLKSKVKDILFEKNDNVTNTVSIKVDTIEYWFNIEGDVGLSKLKPYLDAEEYRYLASLDEKAEMKFAFDMKEPVKYILSGLEVDELIELANEAFEGKGDEIKKLYLIELSLQYEELSVDRMMN